MENIADLYIVSFKMQQKECRKYCFKCDHMLVGIVKFEGGSFIPCRTKDCQHIDKEESLDIVELESGETVNLIVRKLKEGEYGLYGIHRENNRGG